MALNFWRVPCLQARPPQVQQVHRDYGAVGPPVCQLGPEMPGFSPGLEGKRVGALSLERKTSQWQEREAARAAQAGGRHVYQKIGPAGPRGTVPTRRTQLSRREGR